MFGNSTTARNTFEPFARQLMHADRKSEIGNTNRGITNIRNKLFRIAIQKESSSKRSLLKFRKPVKRIDGMPFQSNKLQTNDFKHGTITNVV
jgi:hypothetical protein